MIDLLSKPIGQIGLADIQALIDSEVPEDEQIEFKRELPGEGGKPDPWLNNGKLGTHAKCRILREAIAFANAYGGVLVLGIDESDENPAVATKITPIPRCADLAESLKLVFRDRVEPQLARIDIVGIPTEGVGSGVVVIRVGKSRLAPHRDRRTLVCPVRSANRCEQMTMRQIQQMTLNMSRGLERLEKRLSERSERFREEFARIEQREDVIGIRMTAVPVADEIRFDRVFQQSRLVGELDAEWRSVARNDGWQELLKPPDFPPSFWRPLLRGARAERNAPLAGFLPQYLGYREIYCDGLVEFGLLSVADEERYFLHPDWPLVMFANLASWADHVRKRGGAPTIEYALEVEMRNVGNAGFVRSGSGLWLPGHQVPPKLPNAKFPTYPLNDPDSISDLLGWFNRDFWNAMEEDVEERGFTLK